MYKRQVLIKGGDIETEKILGMFYDDIEILPIRFKAYKLSLIHI